MGAPARVPPPRAGAPIGPVRSRRRPPFCGAAPVGLPALPTVRHRTATPATRRLSACLQEPATAAPESGPGADIGRTRWFASRVAAASNGGAI